MILALKSLWESRDRHAILEMLQKGIGATVDQENGRPGMDTWRMFVLAILKVGLNCDFDRLTHIANNDVLVRQMLQHDAFDFDGTPKYTQQTVVNHVALVTEKMWSKIHQIIVKHGHEIFGVAPDAPLEVRCDSYVVESQVETPHDVRILRDSVLKSMRIAFQAFEKFDLATYDDITGWRQIQHLRMTLGNAYLAIHTSQKRAKYPELILVFFSLCFAWIKKCHLVLDKIKEIDPASKWILHLETAIGQFERQIDLVRRRLIDGETIGNAEKLLSLHAEYTRWIRKGKRYPKEVECGVPQCILEDEHRLILGWEIMWTESDVEMTVPIVTKYTDLYPKIASISFDRGFWSPDTFDALSGLDVQVILPKKGNKNKAEKERESAPEFQEKPWRHAGIESCINCLEQHGGDRIRTKGGKDGFARTIGASVVATNLCRIKMVLMEHERTLLRRAA